MVAENQMPIEGIVSACLFRYKCDRDFSEPTVSFRTEPNMNQASPAIYFITSKDKPPIQNGMYAVGLCHKRNLPYGLQSILEVSELRLYDKKGGNLLVAYEP